MKIIGYTNHLAVDPGQAVDVKVSCDTAQYTADLVQLIHGDTNPDGPGFKIKEVTSVSPTTHPGRIQRIHTGSFCTIDDQHSLRGVSNFTFVTLVNPTHLAAGRQALIAKWNESVRAGAELAIAPDGTVEMRVGDGRGNVAAVSTERVLLEGIWYIVIVSQQRTAHGPSGTGGDPHEQPFRTGINARSHHWRKFR